MIHWYEYEVEFYHVGLCAESANLNLNPVDLDHQAVDVQLNGELVALEYWQLSIHV